MLLVKAERINLFTTGWPTLTHIFLVTIQSNDTVAVPFSASNNVIVALIITMYDQEPLRRTPSESFTGHVDARRHQ